ncbi:MAG: hypothetical protein OXF56_09820 [Rhodobacteraceae bacterium]|nr:hypothetical protein [Paracoccaceae bacterium]
MRGVDTGSARNAAPTGGMEGLGRLNERRHLRTRHVTWPDDGHKLVGIAQIERDLIGEHMKSGFAGAKARGTK